MVILNILKLFDYDSIGNIPSWPLRKAYNHEFRTYVEPRIYLPNINSLSSIISFQKLATQF